jgi:uncharacterized membrane protein YbjE (DUF340 family)
MFTGLIILAAGILLGWLIRRKFHTSLISAIMVTVCVLLFVMGLRTGTNENLIKSISNIGLISVILVVFALGGSLFATKLFTKWMDGGQGAEQSQSANAVQQSDGAAQQSVSTPQQSDNKGSMRDSFIIVGAFILGILLAAFHILPDSWLALDFSIYSNYVLYFLLLLVGVNIGIDDTIFSTVRRLRARVLFTPVITYGGMLIGSAIAFAIIYLCHLGVSDAGAAVGGSAGVAGSVDGAVAAGAGHFSFLNAITINSGLGYYSLTGIMVSETWGAEMGSIALLANLLREFITILCGPLIHKYFGKYAITSAGGATITDTTLPIMLKNDGNTMFPVAIYSGLVFNFAVPVLLAVLLSL